MFKKSAMFVVKAAGVASALAFVILAVQFARVLG